MAEERRFEDQLFWLLCYVTGNAALQKNVAAPNPIERVWLDDVVVSTAYVGPIQR